MWWTDSRTHYGRERHLEGDAEHGEDNIRQREVGNVEVCDGLKTECLSGILCLVCLSVFKLSPQGQRHTWV